MPWKAVAGKMFQSGKIKFGNAFINNLLGIKIIKKVEYQYEMYTCKIYDGENDVIFRSHIHILEKKLRLKKIY